MLSCSPPSCCLCPAPVFGGSMPLCRYLSGACAHVCSCLPQANFCALIPPPPLQTGIGIATVTDMQATFEGEFGLLRSRSKKIRLTSSCFRFISPHLARYSFPGLLQHSPTVSVFLNSVNRSHQSHVTPTSPGHTNTAHASVSLTLSPCLPVSAPMQEPCGQRLPWSQLSCHTCSQN